MAALRLSTPLPMLTAHPVVLRQADPTDAPELLRLVHEPSVAAWWGENTLESITEALQGGFTILIGDQVAGLLECTQELEPTYPSVGFDILLGSAFQGRGHGRVALRLAIDHFARMGHHRFSIDPAVANQAAVRCYTAVGFQPVGILRESERSPDGHWRDALLMDLLAHELA